VPGIWHNASALPEGPPLAGAREVLHQNRLRNLCLAGEWLGGKWLAGE